MTSDPFYDFNALPPPSGNPWATTTTSAIAENLGVFIFDERSGRMQALEVEGVETIAVQTRFSEP